MICHHFVKRDFLELRVYLVYSQKRKNDHIGGLTK